MTVGAALPMAPHEGFGLIFSCNTCVITNPIVPNGASDVSPVDGAIIRWHLNKAVPGGAFRLRVLSRRGPEYVGAGRSAQVTTTSVSAVETFPAHLPIQAGDLIGLELENSQSEFLFGSSLGAEPVLLEPAIADGEPGTPPAWWPEAWWAKGADLPFNAEILLPPRIVSVTPGQGPGGGGNRVTIAGENFAEVTSVGFGSTEAAYTVDSESEITVTAPAGSAGSSVPVSVVTAAGRAEASNGYTYEPSQASVQPNVDIPAPSGCLVPRLKNRRLEVVKRMLSGSNCRLGHVRVRRHAAAGIRRVKRQSPVPGTALPPGGRVEVMVGPTT
ncbi:MAG: IPT/TIG domain-containing protein [Actinobacteria bacterium]|nr:IPT/TIG domain-containing protein [Actinomycetota bacterium]